MRTGDDQSATHLLTSARCSETFTDAATCGNPSASAHALEACQDLRPAQPFPLSPNTSVGPALSLNVPDSVPFPCFAHTMCSFRVNVVLSSLEGKLSEGRNCLQTSFTSPEFSLTNLLSERMTDCLLCSLVYNTDLEFN